MDERDRRRREARLMGADLHLIGACGTFMGGVALLAAEQGARVEGSDRGCYPPMSGQLAAAGVRLREGYAAEGFAPDAKTHVVGNAISRGNPLLEAALDAGAECVSGPEWLAKNVLPGRRVVAVAGTHGKTTVSSMVAAILDRSGLSPGFLIGGVPPGFGVSARLGSGEPFVVEADEYDSAYFDKRPKFMHYRPQVAVLNNLEHDHADIYPDLDSVRLQFGYLLRTVPRGGTVVANADDREVAGVVRGGLHSGALTFGENGEGGLVRDGDCWRVRRGGEVGARALPACVRGEVYRKNALAAVAACLAMGIGIDEATGGLEGFEFPKRRLELALERGGAPVYDDFAHHPTAIRATLDALREIHPGRRIVALFDPQSNTMKSGRWRRELPDAFGDAAVVAIQHDGLSWQAQEALAPLGGRLRVGEGAEAACGLCLEEAGDGDVIVVLSNGDSARLLRLLEGAPGVDRPAAVAAEAAAG